MREIRCSALLTIAPGGDVLNWGYHWLPGVPGHGLLPDRLSGRGRLLHQTRRTAPSSRPGVPALRGAATPGDPPPPSRAGGGPPVRYLWSGVQRLHGDLPAGDPSPPRATPDDPPRGRSGHPHGGEGGRLGLGPQGATGPGARAAGGSPSRRGPHPAGRGGGRGRRDVPNRGEKKGPRTPPPPIRRGGGPTAAGVMAPS